MGDSKEEYDADPYIAIIDEEGHEYNDEEIISQYDIELISYTKPQPIKNTFVFSKISLLHEGSMLVMTGVGILVIVASIIFVKKDKKVEYKTLDKVSFFMNLAIGVFAIPFMALIAWLMQIYVAGYEFDYQFNLCIPVITTFGIALSIIFRRKGYTKTGFFIQFVGPVLFLVLLNLEALIACF